LEQADDNRSLELFEMESPSKMKRLQGLVKAQRRESDFEPSSIVFSCCCNLRDSKMQTTHLASSSSSSLSKAPAILAIVTTPVPPPLPSQSNFSESLPPPVSLETATNNTNQVVEPSPPLRSPNTTNLLSEGEKEKAPLLLLSLANLTDVSTSKSILFFCWSSERESLDNDECESWVEDFEVDDINISFAPTAVLENKISLVSPGHAKAAKTVSPVTPTRCFTKR
jgi:hypothetical protein